MSGGRRRGGRHKRGGRYTPPQRRHTPEPPPSEAEEFVLGMAAYMAQQFSIPFTAALDAVGIMYTTPNSYQCASCLAVHRDLGMLSVFQANDIYDDMTIVWAACSTCVDAFDKGGQEVVGKLSDIAETTLLAWMDGSLKPQGQVVLLKHGADAP